jgi:hypothetical protein
MEQQIRRAIPDKSAVAHHLEWIAAVLTREKQQQQNHAPNPDANSIRL